jgi:hypothetical protein
MIMKWGRPGLLWGASVLFSLVAQAEAEELPANFVWCDCICGGYDPLNYECTVSVPNAKVSHYLEKISPLSLRAGAAISFRSACQKPETCRKMVIKPWSAGVPRMPLKGFVAVKLQASHPYGPIPVGSSFTLNGSAFQPAWDRLYPVSPPEDQKSNP